MGAREEIKSVPQTGDKSFAPPAHRAADADQWSPKTPSTARISVGAISLQ